MPSPKDPSKASDNYRKPPAEYRFKKGQSGNAKGRPKKKRVKPGGGALGGGFVDRISAMALDEANRLITVKEGDQEYKIPAMQALLRTMIRAGAKGDVRAAAKVLDVVARAESARIVAAEETLAEAFGHIEEHLPMFVTHEREGLPPPEIYPHPDDFLFNEVTGEVGIDGPLSKEQAGARKAVRETALQAMPRYFEVKYALAKDPKNRTLRKELKGLQEYFDFLEADAKRNSRHKALQQARRALAPQPADHDDEQSDNRDG